MKKKIAFVCVHNSCRSQIAEALMKKIGGEFFDVYSAGTELKEQINQDAVQFMKEVHNIDMEESQRPKLMEELPKVDYLVTMGCNVTCPFLPYEYKSEDWGLDDPTGKGRDEFIKTIETIEGKVREFIEREK